eukprot:8581552-Pyramimonas_sp.AAC.1
MRNLGHELHGPRVLRRIEKKRVRAMRERKHRLLLMRKAVGRKTSTIWRTGVMSSVGHGAGVSGLADAPLREMRNLTGPEWEK